MPKPATALGPGGYRRPRPWTDGPALHEPARRRRPTPSPTALGGLDDWGLAGTRAGQYRSDLAADAAAARACSTGAGRRRAERGVGPAPARRGDHGRGRSARRLDQRLAGDPLVRHQPVRRRRRRAAGRAGREPGVGRAVRGRAGRRGARATARRSRPAASTDARRRRSSGCPGYPPRHLGWKQFRALGAAALDLCAVAAGVARRLRRLQLRRPRLVGLPRRPARVPRGGRRRSSTPTAVTSSCSTTTPAARRSPRPRPSCSTRWSPAGLVPSAPRTPACTGQRRSCRTLMPDAALDPPAPAAALPPAAACWLRRWIVRADRPVVHRRRHLLHRAGRRRRAPRAPRLPAALGRPRRPARSGARSRPTRPGREVLEEVGLDVELHRRAGRRGRRRAAAHRHHLPGPPGRRCRRRPSRARARPRSSRSAGSAPTSCPSCSSRPPTPSSPWPAAPGRAAGACRCRARASVGGVARPGRARSDAVTVGQSRGRRRSGVGGEAAARRAASAMTSAAPSMWRWRMSDPPGDDGGVDDGAAGRVDEVVDEVARVHLRERGVDEQEVGRRADRDAAGRRARGTAGPGRRRAPRAAGSDGGVVGGVLLDQGEAP